MINYYQIGGRLPLKQRRMLRRNARLKTAMENSSEEVTPNIEIMPIDTSSKIVAMPLTYSAPAQGLDLRGYNPTAVNNEAINNALADAVIAGKVGSGKARREALGTRYRDVQNIVDRRLAVKKGADVKKNNTVKNEVTPVVEELPSKINSILDANASVHPELIQTVDPKRYYNSRNTGVPFSESGIAKTIEYGNASEWNKLLNCGGKVKKNQDGSVIETPDTGVIIHGREQKLPEQDWLSIWQNQRALPIENDSDTAPLYKKTPSVLVEPNVDSILKARTKKDLDTLSEIAKMNILNKRKNSVLVPKYDTGLFKGTQKLEINPEALVLNCGGKVKKHQGGDVVEKEAFIEPDHNTYTVTRDAYGWELSPKNLHRIVWRNTLRHPFNFGNKVLLRGSGTTRRGTTYNWTFVPTLGYRHLFQYPDGQVDTTLWLRKSNNETESPYTQAKYPNPEAVIPSKSKWNKINSKFNKAE